MKRLEETSDAISRGTVSLYPSRLDHFITLALRANNLIKETEYVKYSGPLELKGSCLTFKIFDKEEG